MSEGSLIVSLVSIIAMVTCLSLGTYVMLRNPHLKSSRLFFLLAAIATLAAMADYLIITASDEVAARLVAHPLILLSILLAATMFYLTSYLPYERELSWVVRNKREFAVVVAVIAAVPSLMINTVAEDQYGWWISMSAPVIWWYVVIGFFYLAGIITMAQLYRADGSEYVRRRIIPLVIAMTLPIVSAAIVSMINMSGQRSPPDLSTTILASSLFFAYAIFRQKLFVLRPVEQEAPVENTASVMAPGQCVLVEGATPDRAYNMFANELASGGQGLLITTERPDQVRERYALRSAPVLWLTNRPGPDSVDPSSLNILMHTTLQFLQRGKGSVILLDGVERLKAFNRPAEVMLLLYGLRDAAIVTGSKLIVSVNPDGLERKELPMLEREFELLRPNQ
jgi:hypothetical protein